MPNWKKVIVSGSNAVLNNITASGAISASGELYAGLSAWSGIPSNNQVVTWNSATGELMYTGSYSSADTSNIIGITEEDGTPMVSIPGTYNTMSFESGQITFDGTKVIISAPTLDQVTDQGNTTANSALFLTSPDLVWGNSGTATKNADSGFLSNGTTAKTHVTPQHEDVNFFMVGVRSANIIDQELSEYPNNYLVYHKVSYLGTGGDLPDGGGGGGGTNPGGGGTNDDDHPSDEGGHLQVTGKSINLIASSSTESSETNNYRGVGIYPSALYFFNTDASGSVSGALQPISASAKIKFDTGSNAVKFFAGSTDEELKEVMHISKSGDNPRIGIGVTNPLKAFDFKDVSDTTRGGEMLIRGSRTTKGAEVGDEAGRINFAIDSGSYGKVETSGSTAEIVALVDSVDETGTQGSLSLRVSEGKTLEPQQRIKLVGAPGGGPYLEVTGSSEFSSDVTVKGNFIIDGKIDSFITASSGISASGDIETSGDVIATNFVVSEDGNLKTVGSGEYVNLQTDQIALGFGSSWSAYFKKDEGFIFNDINTGPFGTSFVRDFRVKGLDDSDLFLISGADATVGIGTSTPDEKLTVDGNIKASGNIIATGDIIAQNYIVSSSVTYMTQSFSSGSTIFGDTLDDTHQFTGSILYTGSLDINGMTYPTTDGNDGQVLLTDGDGVLTFGDVKVYAQVKNISGVTLAKGTPVHATASASPPAGNVSEVIAASASLASSMPATFVLDEDLADEAEGRAILSGFINGVDTSTFKEGDVVYVGPDGGYTTTKPTGTNLIQNLGIITKVDASNGAGYIYGSGRSNDVPNITEGYAWVGNSSGVATATSTSSFVVTTSNTASYVAAGNIDGTIDISDQTNLAGGTNLTLSGDTMNLDANISLTNITASGNISASGDITSNTFETISTTLASDSATNVDTFASSSYNGAIYDYILKDTGVGARAGQFMVAHDSGLITFTDNSTKHLSDATAPEISAQINGANIEVQVTNGNGYTFKSFVKKL